MASSTTLQMSVAIMLVLALALLLQCLGSGGSDSCDAEAVFELDDDEASLMQLGERVVRRRLLDGGASPAEVADREEDGKQREQRKAATASVDTSSTAGRATTSNLDAAPSRETVAEGGLPRKLAAGLVNDAVMGAFVNISFEQDPAMDPQPKTFPQIAAKVEGGPGLLHKDTFSGISLVSKTIQNLWQKVDFAAKNSAAQDTTAGSFGLTIVIVGVVGITLVFLFVNCWEWNPLERRRPRNISSIPGRIGSPQPARQVPVRQTAHWWHSEPSAGKAAEEPPRRPVLDSQTSPSTGSGLQTWTSPSAGSCLQAEEASEGFEKTKPYVSTVTTSMSNRFIQAPSIDKQNEPLLPELRGAIVPANRKFVVHVPPLLHSPAHITDMSRTVQVTTNHGEPLFLIKRSKPTPSGREVVIEEYFSISLPDEIDKDLLICTFGRPRGPQLQCEIHKSDGLGHSTLFGVMYQEPANSGVVPYTLFLASGKRLLTVMVNGNVKDRQIKIWDFNRPGGEVAAAVPGDTGEEPYKVECYPHSDVILSVIVMTVVDRLAASGR